MFLEDHFPPIFRKRWKRFFPASKPLPKLPARLFGSGGGDTKIPPRFQLRKRMPSELPKIPAFFRLPAARKSPNSKIAPISETGVIPYRQGAGGGVGVRIRPGGQAARWPGRHGGRHGNAGLAARVGRSGGGPDGRALAGQGQAVRCAGGTSVPAGSAPWRVWRRTTVGRLKQAHVSLTPEIRYGYQRLTKAGELFGVGQNAQGVARDAVDTVFVYNVD